jgi:hypothetical protein
MSRHYEILVDALRLAAAEPETQIKSLPDFVHIPDEIALNFDDAYIYKKELLIENRISAEMAELLDEIHKESDFMSDNKVGWKIEDLSSSHHWKKIRETAKKLLHMMGEEIQPPKLDWVSYYGVSDKSDKNKKAITNFLKRISNAIFPQKR